ncbi:MAG: S41 family peptidase [Synoicihabitans sp.]
MADRARAQEAVLREAWKLVDKRFYDPDFNGADWATAFDRHREAARQAMSQEELYEVINDMLDELEDGHTGALSPIEAWEDLRAERAFVGLNLERLDNQWVVTELRPDSAAAESEIKPGWIATGRDGEPLPETRLNFESVPGQTYTWTFVDGDDQERAVPLVARTLPDWMPPQERYSAEGWIYLRFDEFEPEYHRWLRDRLKVHREAPGVILDLRNNGGGAVSSLEHVINDFFPHRVSYGAFVSRKGKRDNEKSAWREGVGYDGPVVVLIGGGSASSAEILAQVFKHYERATLIGRPTAGVVIASRFFTLRDGGELQIGLHDFEAPDGTRLEGNGVQPDIEVERRLADIRDDHDADLEAAVEWLRAHASVAETAKL